MEYSIKYQRGIHDLKPQYAFRGNSQGDETETSSIKDYLASEGWLSFILLCPMTASAIKKQIKSNKEYNREYIEKLKKEGRFGEEYSIQVITMPNAALDNREEPNYSLQNYSFIIMDYNEPKDIEKRN